MNKLKPQETKVTASQVPIQLELFGSTQQLNLSDIYEAIPKEVSPKHPAIQWETDNIALPVEIPFSLPQGNSGQSKAYVSEIHPAFVKDPKTGITKTKFPYFRESRVEYAILAIASKEWMDVTYDEKRGGEPRYYLSTSIYRIQQEIANSLNEVEGSSLTANTGPHNSAAIREAINILADTKNVVRNADTNEISYRFNRIKDIVSDERGKLVLELGTLVDDYINNGSWRAVDSSAILASKTYYTMKLRTLLHLKFVQAKHGATTYRASIHYLMEKTGFPASDRMTNTISRFNKVIEALSEVEEYHVEYTYEGKKVVSAMYYFRPSKGFANKMIVANKLQKRVHESIFVEQTGELLIEPIESQFQSKREFHQALENYRVTKGKFLHAQRFLEHKKS